MIQAARKDTPFDGFIADGANLSNRMQALADRSTVRKYYHKSPYSKDIYDKDITEETTGHPYLSPLLTLDKITKPIGIFQRADDNNTNLKAALTFYEEARKLNKDATLYITPRGSEMTSTNIWAQGTQPDTLNKGHALPPPGKEFNAYIQALIAFMEKGKTRETPQPFVHPLGFKAYHYLANRFFREATPKERCLGEMMAAFLLSEKSPYDVETNWDQEYAPQLKNMYRAFLHIAVILGDKSSKFGTNLVSLRDGEKNRLQSWIQNRPNTQVFQQAIQFQLPQILMFMGEYYNLNSPVPFHTNQILIDKLSPLFQKKFFNALTVRPFSDVYYKYILPDSQQYMEAFYHANPEVLDISSLENTSLATLYAEEKKYLNEELIQAEKLISNKEETKDNINQRLSFLGKLEHPEKMEEDLQQLREEFITYIKELIH